MKSKVFLIFMLSIGLLYGKRCLTITEAYNLGLLNSHKIKSSFYQYRATQQKIKEQESSLYPHITLTATLNREINKLNRKGEFNTTNSTETQKSVSINFTQVVYNASLKLAADIEKKKSELYLINHNILKQNFATEVLDKYFKILQSQNRIVILKSYVDYYSSLLKLAKGKLEFNLINKMELLNIEVNLEKTKLQIQKEYKLTKLYKKSLSYLIGIQNNQITLPQRKFTTISNKTLNHLRAIVQNLNPKKRSLEYLKAKKSIEIMEKKIEEAKSARMPTINFQANYTKYFSIKKNSYYKNRKTISLQLNMPIYQGGMINSKIEEAKLNKLAALEDAATKSADIDISYQQELVNFKFLIKSIKHYKKTLKEAKLYYQLAFKGYKNGLKSLVDVYEAKSKLNETKFQYMQNIYDMIVSYVKLLVISNNMDKLTLIDKIIK